MRAGKTSLDAENPICISIEIHIGFRIKSGDIAMAAHTSMLHVRVDDKLKAAAAENLANFGLSISDAVRILLARVAKECGLTAGLKFDPEAYDKLIRFKVFKTLADHTTTFTY